MLLPNIYSTHERCQEGGWGVTSLYISFNIPFQLSPKLSPPYIAIRNLIISQFPGSCYMDAERIWGAANMTCCHGGCVSRMRLVQVAILLLISPAFLFTTVTTSTVQAGAESCTGNNAGDENVVVAAQAIPTGGSIQSHNGKYSKHHRLGDSGQNRSTSKFFQSPTGYMLISFTFSFINLRYNLEISLKWSALCPNLTSSGSHPKFSHLSCYDTYIWGYVVGCGSKYRYQNDMCFREIGLHVQIMITTLDSIVYLIGGTYVII